jgi:hypothetical protein
MGDAIFLNSQVFAPRLVIPFIAVVFPLHICAIAQTFVEKGHERISRKNASFIIAPRGLALGDLHFYVATWREIGEFIYFPYKFLKEIVFVMPVGLMHS